MGASQTAAALLMVDRRSVVPCVEVARAFEPACICARQTRKSNCRPIYFYSVCFATLDMTIGALSDWLRSAAWAGAAASLPSRALSRSGDGGLSSEFACVTLWIDTSPSLHSVRSSPSFVAFFHAFHAPLLLPPLFPPPLESRPFFFIVIARSAQIDDATSTSASLPHSPALSPLPSCLCRKTETRRSPFSLSLSLSLST